MGGFHIFDGDMPLYFLPPDEVITLVRRGALIPPSEYEINDRSKGDDLSKIFVVVQALWFVMQITARRVEDLPITDLEITTLAYTLPIICIYACWWHKPLDISEPIRVSNILLRDLPVDAPCTDYATYLVNVFEGELSQ